MIALGRGYDYCDGHSPRELATLYVGLEEQLEYNYRYARPVSCQQSRGYFVFLGGLFPHSQGVMGITVGIVSM